MIPGVPLTAAETFAVGCLYLLVAVMIAAVMLTPLSNGGTSVTVRQQPLTQQDYMVGAPDCSAPEYRPAHCWVKP